MRQLTASDLDELEDVLRRQRAGVLDTIHARMTGRDADQQRELVNYFAEGDTRAAAEQLGETDRLLLQHELAELDAIDAALKRIDFGAGGLCAVCGNPIPLARLRAVPTTLTCVDCQAGIEAQGSGLR